mgnify:CR=1 FL=1
MFHTHLTDIVKMRHLLFFAEIAAHFALNGRLDILVGREVIHYHGDAVFVVDTVKTELVKLANRHRRGDVVAENTVKLHQNQLSGFNFVKPGVCGKNFLRHCHRHKICSFFRNLKCKLAKKHFRKTETLFRKLSAS